MVYRLCLWIQTTTLPSIMISKFEFWKPIYNFLGKPFLIMLKGLGNLGSKPRSYVGFTLTRKVHSSNALTTYGFNQTSLVKELTLR